MTEPETAGHPFSGGVEAAVRNVCGSGAAQGKVRPADGARRANRWGGCGGICHDHRMGAWDAVASRVAGGTTVTSQPSGSSVVPLIRSRQQVPVSLGRSTYTWCHLWTLPRSGADQQQPWPPEPVTHQRHRAAKAMLAKRVRVREVDEARALRCCEYAEERAPWVLAARADGAAGRSRHDGREDRRVVVHD